MYSMSCESLNSRFTSIALIAIQTSGQHQSGGRSEARINKDAKRWECIQVKITHVLFSRHASTSLYLRCLPWAFRLRFLITMVVSIHKEAEVR